MKSILLFTILFSLISNKPEYYEPSPLQDEIKIAAFQVLELKCNSCHSTKKKAENFTAENMTELAPSIWKQVFVKKKMPKGRKNKLTAAESQALEDWLKMTLEDKK